MAKIIVMEFLTLDGIMETPEAWQFPYFSQDIAEANVKQIHQLDALLLGRATYDIFAPSWSSRINNEFGIADKFNTMPKYMVSNTLENADWNATTIISGDAIAKIRKLKSDFNGTIAIIGSATLVQSLMNTDLIDEIQLQIYPLVLGTGKRLFEGDMSQQGLKLCETQTYQSGTVALIYQPVRG